MKSIRQNLRVWPNRRKKTDMLIMKQIAEILIICLLIGVCAAETGGQQQAAGTVSGAETTWKKLAEGLELGIFRSPQPSEIGDSMLRVLRIDPNRFRFKLLNASATEKGRSLSARDWSLQNGLVAAINASMYQADYKTSVSLMRTETHVNNPRLSKDMTILAFGRKSSDLPPVKIIDRQCEDFEFWKNKYDTLIQSIRMISCTGKNVWSPQPLKWSTAAIGIDHQDRVLFIHVGSPYSTHELINILKILPLQISRAMYAEGGPQAQLYIKIDEHEYEFVGDYEINLNNNKTNLFSWPIPNVVGITLTKD